MLKKLSRLACVLTLSCAAAVTIIPAKPAFAQEVLLGQLMAFAGNYCPRNWANADGSLLSIGTYSALYSIYGTMYGGDGHTSFALPDLRNRAIVHVGNSPEIGQSPSQGVRTGATSVTLQQNNLPSHTHRVLAAASLADNSDPSGRLIAGAKNYHDPSGVNMIPLAANMIGKTGGGQPIQKHSPVQVIRYCVAISGIFPSRP